MRCKNRKRQATLLQKANGNTRTHSGVVAWGATDLVELCVACRELCVACHEL